MQEFKEISIVIVNYKSRDHLGPCVDSIFSKLGDTNLEILLVNNDQEEDITSSLFNFSEIKIFNKGENIGFAAAANYGAKQARGRWLLFLNPDARLLTSQAKIVELTRKGGGPGIISPQLLNEKGRMQSWSWGKMPSLLELFRNNIRNKTYRENEPDATAKKVDWVSGAAMFVKKDLFDKLGGFDENFFMYFEDIDLCKRAKEIGIETAYFPEEKVEHLGGKSAEDKREQKKHYYKSQDHYFRKHHGKVNAVILRFLREIFKKNNA